MTVFEIRSYRGGWQCLEAPGVAPYFTEGDAKQSVISYALGRTAHRHGEIRGFNAAGELEESIARRSSAGHG